MVFSLQKQLCCLNFLFVTIEYKSSLYFIIYTVSEFNTKMNKSKLKRKGVSSTIGPYNKCTTNNKTLGFQNLCKEITKQQIDVLKLGKFVVNNLIAVKHY